MQDIIFSADIGQKCSKLKADVYSFLKFSHSVHANELNKSQDRLCSFLDGLELPDFHFGHLVEVFYALLVFIGASFSF
jgi:hypothetical protein